MGEKTALEMLSDIMNGRNVHSNDTKMHPSQPLNTIAGDGLDETSPSDAETTTKIEDVDDVSNLTDKKTEKEFCEEICSICQINKILGTCNHCGIYIYGLDN